MNRLVHILKSKTVWGTVAAVIGWATQQPKLDTHTILVGAGTVLASAGLRDSVTKIIEEVRRR